MTKTKTKYNDNFVNKLYQNARDGYFCLEGVLSCFALKNLAWLCFLKLICVHVLYRPTVVLN